MNGSSAAAYEGDPYGYTTRFSRNDAASEISWKGPLGKRSLQFTCFEPHASAIRDQELESGDWVLVRNVQVKYSRNGVALEGYVREERDKSGTRVNITRIDLDQCSDTILAERLKSAMDRKREYEGTQKARRQSLLEATKAGQKRRAGMIEEGEEPKTSKKRRRARRSAQQTSNVVPERQEMLPNLNQQGTFQMVSQGKHSC
jgi:hypothetical protein